MQAIRCSKSEVEYLLAGGAVQKPERNLPCCQLKDVTTKTMKTIALSRGEGDSESKSINNRDELVGTLGIAEHGTAVGGFLYRDGQRTDIADLLPPGSGWNILTAEYIKRCRADCRHRAARRRIQVLSADTHQTPQRDAVAQANLMSTRSKKLVTATLAILGIYALTPFIAGQECPETHTSKN